MHTVGLLEAVTRQGQSISGLFAVELIISALLLAGVITLLIVVLVRFRARPGEDAEPLPVHGNRALEVAWTTTPALTLAVIFGLVIQTMRTVDAQQSGARSLTVIGHQWWWEYRYPDQQVVAANELHVPVGAPLQIGLQSVDVIHSFHVVQFGWMQDLVPGQTNSMSVLVERPGTYDGACNQYCGLQHAWMRLRVVAESADQFAAWLQLQQQSVVPDGSRGEQVFLRNTCVACHTLRGLPGATGTVGPDLTHVGSRATLGAGVIDNTLANLRNWVRDPQAIKPGVLMPAYRGLDPADLNALASYLESLR